MKTIMTTIALAVTLLSDASAATISINADGMKNPETSRIECDNCDDKNPIDQLISKAVAFPRHIGIAKGQDEVFLHLYVSDEGRIYVLEAYSPNSELKKYVIGKLHKRQLEVPNAWRGRNYEFKMRFVLA